MLFPQECEVSSDVPVHGITKMGSKDTLTISKVSDRLERRNQRLDEA